MLQRFECNPNGYLKVWNRNGSRQRVQTDEKYNGMAGGYSSGWILDFLEIENRNAGWDYRDFFIIRESATSEALSTYRDLAYRPATTVPLPTFGGPHSSHRTATGLFQFQWSDGISQATISSRLSLS